MQKNENALGRTVRLLKKLSDVISSPDTEENTSLSVIISVDGSSEVVTSAGLVLFDANSTERLEAFLAAPLSRQITLIGQ